MASRLLMAVLSIPLPLPQTDADKYLMFDEVAREKSRRLATLLGLTTVPTRKKLVSDLVRNVYIFQFCCFKPVCEGKSKLFCVHDTGKNFTISDTICFEFFFAERNFKLSPASRCVVLFDYRRIIQLL